ncbi:MAG: DUF21 domain-containing protein [Xanthomonadaceae bacterium]|nr:DUF21 domain-containing protein [Xanthomonadaceae bacterium]
MNAFQLGICIILISISGFLSGSEVALFSLSRFQLRTLKDKYKSAHRKVRELLSDPPGLLLSLLLTNELVNITLSAIIAENVAHRWTMHESILPMTLAASYPIWFIQLAEGVLITGPIVLLLCEMTPKALGAKLNFLVAPLVTHPLYSLYQFMKPLRWMLFPKRDSAPSKKEKHVIREDEFLTLVEQGHEEGSIEKAELELIKNVFELDDTTVSEISIPIAKTFTLSSEITLGEAVQQILNSSYSRIPVVSGKDIVGIVYKKDLLLNPEFQTSSKQPITGWMRSPLTVAPDMQINTLFRQLRQSKTHMAVVKDVSQNKTIGIVTMKDVLTELFEDILS